MLFRSREPSCLACRWSRRRRGAASRPRTFTEHSAESRQPGLAFRRCVASASSSEGAMASRMAIHGALTLIRLPLPIVPSPAQPQPGPGLSSHQGRLSHTVAGARSACLPTKFEPKAQGRPIASRPGGRRPPWQVPSWRCELWTGLGAVRSVSAADRKSTRLNSSHWE